MFLKLKQILPKANQLPDLENNVSKDPYVPTSANNDKLVHV